MCDADEAMEKCNQLEDRLNRVDAKIQAILDYLKMSIKYTPESYEVMKPEDIGMSIPMKVR